MFVKMDAEFLKYKYEDGHIGVITKTKFRIGIRHVQTIYMLACTILLGVLRGSVGIAELALTDESRQNDTYIQVYDWNRKIQGTLMSSYLWGYTLMLIPAEFIIIRIKGKFLMAAVLAANGAILVALPTIINKGGWVPACNAQFIMGITQACLSPAIQDLIEKWLPPYERNHFNWIIYTGIQLGIIIAYPLSASLSTAQLGWELIYYSFGMLTISMFTIWILLTSGSPEEHPAVGDKEKEFISEAMSCYKKKELPTPWCNILKTKAFWAITSAHASTAAIFAFYLCEVPAYLTLALRIQLYESAWYSALPFAAVWLIYMLSAQAVERLYNIGLINYMFNVTQTRKLINILGCLGTVFGLTCLAYLGADSTKLIVIILISTYSSMALQYVGFLENYNDITENFTRSVMVVSGAIANIAGAITPAITGYIMNKNMEDLKYWRIVFLSLALFHTVCNVVYTLFASAERQFWDNNKRGTYGYVNDVNQLELEVFPDKLLQAK